MPVASSKSPGIGPNDIVVSNFLEQHDTFGGVAWVVFETVFAEGAEYMSDTGQSGNMVVQFNINAINQREVGIVEDHGFCTFYVADDQADLFVTKELRIRAFHQGPHPKVRALVESEGVCVLIGQYKVQSLDFFMRAVELVQV